MYSKDVHYSHLNHGGGLACASHINVTSRPSDIDTTSTLDLGGKRGGLPPTGSRNQYIIGLEQKSLMYYE